MDPLTIVGVGLIVATVGSLVGLHAGKVVVPRVGRWAAPPDVLILPGAPVSLRQVQEAVAFWAELGFQFGDILERVHPLEHGSVVPGAIIIARPDVAWLESAAGRATWLTKPIGEEDGDSEALKRPDEHFSLAQDVIGPVHEGLIWGARIGVDPTRSPEDRRKILIHELGHALGFQHCETAVFGRRKKDSKNGKHAAGDARLSLAGRKTGHVMNPLLSNWGPDTTGMKP